jgi:outer membrane protein
LPTLDFTANYYENGRLEQTSTDSHTRESVVGITVNIPIFDGFSRTYKVRGAEAQVEQKRAELQDTEHQVSVEMIKAHTDAVAALHNLDASAKLLNTAQEALQASKRKYEKGARPTSWKCSILRPPLPRHGKNESGAWPNGDQPNSVCWPVPA